MGYISAIFTLFCCWFSLFPGDFPSEGLVLSVHDGDSVTLLVRGREMKTRFLYIDAPELAQTCEGREIGKLAGKSLQGMILGKKVTFFDRGVDIYGRHLVEVFHQNQFINLEMVKRGSATLYAYSRFQNQSQKQTFLNAFSLATKNKMGIHECRRFEAPWHFRKRQKHPAPLK